MRAAITCSLALAMLPGCAAPEPEIAPVLAQVALRNPGFEDPPRPRERCASGWDCTMHSDGDSFRFTLEESSPAAGMKSLCVERVRPEPWATLTQHLDSTPLRGKRLRLSFRMRAERLDGEGAGPFFLVQGHLKPILDGKRLVKSTEGWTRMAIEFTVPEAGLGMDVGGTLEGGGRVCFDEMRLEVLSHGKAAL